MGEFGFNGSPSIGGGSSGLTYLGAWDAFLNFPTITSSVGTNGNYYIVSVSGTTNINGISDWQIGDWIIFNGSVWQKIDNSDVVGYDLIQNDGASFPKRNTLNFKGAAVSVSDNINKTDVTIDTVGGGSSIAYYLNGSVNQGIFAGNTYYQLSKTAVLGVGTDFNINTNGVIARFITDSNDPSLLEIPNGNWTCGFYFSASSSGGNPLFYANIYKYDGTTFTLLGSNALVPEDITSGTIIDDYFFTVAIPLTTLNITDRISIEINVINDGRTITLHTEDSHVCQVITTFNKGIININGLTKQIQNLAVGNSGLDFNISSAISTHTFNLPTASSINRGALSSADWINFNSKLNQAYQTIQEESVALTQQPIIDFQGSGVTATNGIGKTIVTINGISQPNSYNFGQTQWSTTAPLTGLPTGQTANGFSFFTDGANKLVAGTTAYDEYFLSAGRTLTLTGTSGSANINILGVNYLATFSVNLTTTANNFVTLYQATLLALGIQVFANSGVLKFGKKSDLVGGSVDLSAITITNVVANLSGTFSTTINDHVVIPYLGTAYNGLRLNHLIRVNFNIVSGNTQYLSLQLRRWQNDTTIGSEIVVARNQTLTGVQEVFVSYTAGANDPFVTGGFYFALSNTTGVLIEISGSAGILIQTSYQKQVAF